MFQDYKIYLRTQLENRIKKNPRYSLRMMASKIGISPSTLSDLMNDKRSCSIETAEKISHFFEMSLSVKEHFLSLVKIDSIKNPEVKKRASNAVFIKARLNSRQNFDQNIFEIISEWYHNAILALLKTDGAWNQKTISHALGVSIHETKSALNRLLEAQLIQFKNKAYVASIGNPLLSSSIPNAALRKYHRQLLTKAISAIEEQTPQEKIIRTETLAFDKKDLAEVDALISELMCRLVEISQHSRKKNSVYHASFQFFKLNKRLL